MQIGAAPERERDPGRYRGHPIQGRRIQGPADTGPADTGAVETGRPTQGHHDRAASATWREAMLAILGRPLRNLGLFLLLGLMGLKGGTTALLGFPRHLDGLVVEHSLRLERFLALLLGLAAFIHPAGEHSP